MLTLVPGYLPRTALLQFMVEALLLIIILALFSHGYPDNTRITLWKEGGVKHFNSNPALRIYFYANHNEPPAIPYIWAQTSSNYNLAVGILSAWVFVARSLLQCSNVLGKWIELFLHCCVLPFWILSVVGQQSADLTDTEHISRSPWYLSVSCSCASLDAQTACLVAQASFGMTIVAVTFYSTCIWRIVGFEIFEYWLKESRMKMKASRPMRPPISVLGDDVLSDTEYFEGDNLL